MGNIVAVLRFTSARWIYDAAATGKTMRRVVKMPYFHSVRVIKANVGHVFQ